MPPTPPPNLPPLNTYNLPSPPLPWTACCDAPLPPAYNAYFLPSLLVLTPMLTSLVYPLLLRPSFLSRLYFSQAPPVPLCDSVYFPLPFHSPFHLLARSLPSQLSHVRGVSAPPTTLYLASAWECPVISPKAPSPALFPLFPLPHAARRGDIAEIPLVSYASPTNKRKRRVVAAISRLA